MTKGDNYLCVQDGAREVHYEYSITPVQESAGKMLGVVVLLHNVTKLKELDRMKDEFVMTASHELRTPLTSIGMSIDLLRERAEDRFDQPDRELLDVAHEEVERLKNLVNELLDLTRIESGRIPLRFSEVSVRRLLETALMPFRSQAKEQSVELALQISGELPPVWADAAKLTLVVTNLVGNALRYTPAAGHVWVSAESAGPWVHICVRDEGKGIPPELQAKIFDKFVQIDGAGRPGGGGLGLALAKEIVRAHHGSIWVESEPGKGSLFTVVLPALRPTAQGNQA
jgi:NtrC-family two-component system sensor histidine kinase KinB